MQSNRKQPALFVLALLFLGALASCGRTILPSAPAPPSTPETRAYERVYATAELYYKNGQMDKAEQAYRDYLAQYPQSALAPAAWLKIGQIAAAQGKHEKARNAFRQVLAKFPASPLANDAKWGVLDTYYREERYEVLIPQLKRLAAKPSGAAEKVQALSMLGDVYMAWGEAENALKSYLEAHGEASGGGRDLLFMKMEKVMDLLSPPQAREILAGSRNCSAVGLYWLKLAHSQINQEQWAEAAATLNTLLSRCPGHERESEARMLLESLQQVESFQTSVIGCLLPLTGPYERFGAQLLSGVELAVSAHNAKNPKRTYRMAVRDTKGDPQEAAAGFAELASQDAAVVIGPLLAAEAIAEPARELGLPAIVFTQKPGLAQPGGYVFRNFLTLPMQTRALVSHAAGTLGLTRFAILYPEDEYGRASMRTFWDEAAKQGGRVMGVESYPTGTTDFADPIQKLVGLYYDRPETGTEEAPVPDPDQDAEVSGAPERDGEPEPIVDFEVLFIPDSPGTAGLIMPQLKFHDVKDVVLMGTNVWHSPKLLEVAGVYANGAVMADIFFSESPDPVVRDFVRLFEENYGSPPGFLEALGYDSANMVFQVMALPQVFSRESFRAAMAEAEFLGVTGKTSYDAYGEVAKELYLLTVKKQRFEQIPKPQPKLVFPNADADAGRGHERPY